MVFSATPVCPAECLQQSSHRVGAGRAVMSWQLRLQRNGQQFLAYLLGQGRPMLNHLHTEAPEHSHPSRVLVHAFSRVRLNSFSSVRLLYTSLVKVLPTVSRTAAK